MKDANHHRKHVQKKVVQSIRRPFLNQSKFYKTETKASKKG